MESLGLLGWLLAGVLGWRFDDLLQLEGWNALGVPGGRERLRVSHLGGLEHFESCRWGSVDDWAPVLKADLWVEVTMRFKIINPILRQASIRRLDPIFRCGLGSS